MLVHKKSSAAQLLRLHPVGLDELDGLQPELRVAVAVLEVNVGWLGALVAEEEEAKPLGHQESGHAQLIARCRRSPTARRGCGDLPAEQLITSCPTPSIAVSPAGRERYSRRVSALALQLAPSPPLSRPKTRVGGFAPGGAARIGARATSSRGAHWENRGGVRRSAVELWCYLSPEPALQDPTFASSMAKQGFSVPAYAYALNNPIAVVDPDGRNPWLLFLGLSLWLANDETTTDGSQLGELLAGASLATPVITKLIIQPTGGQPANPDGCSSRKVGEEFGWGGSRSTGETTPSRVPESRPPWMTREYTKAWRDFYKREAQMNPKNPSAAGRQQHLDNLLNNKGFWK